MGQELLLLNVLVCAEINGRKMKESSKNYSSKCRSEEEEEEEEEEDCYIHLYLK